MKLYADLPALRARQLVKDVLLTLWVVLWVRLGRGLYDVIERLRAAGDTTEAAGDDLADRMTNVAGSIERVPLVGEALRRPFLGAADAGRTLEAAGAASSDAVHTLALWLGVLLAVVPIVWLAAKYLPGRVRWVREATAAVHIALDERSIELLAWRAAVNHPLTKVAPIAGDRVALARLELRRLGLRR